MPSAQRRTSARPAGRRPQKPAEPKVSVDRAAVVAVVEPVVVAAGYDLEDLAVVRMGRRFVVRASVDRDGGVPLDDVADLARDISAALDAAESGTELIPSEYQLEVSSPGVDRPLKLPRHWRRNVGRLVKVRIGDGTVVGRVIATDDAGVRLDVDGEVREVAYADLGSGRVEIEFHRIEEIAEDDMVAFDDDDDAGDAGDDDDEDEEDER